MSRTIDTHAVATAMLLLLSACATTEVPPPSDDIAAAAAAIDRARQADAGRHAAFPLAQAERKLDRAQLLAREDDEARLTARHLAQQSIEDARLAEEQARLAQTRSIYDDVRQTVDTLRTAPLADPGQTSEGTP